MTRKGYRNPLCILSRCKYLQLVRSRNKKKGNVNYAFLQAAESRDVDRVLEEIRGR